MWLTEALFVLLAGSLLLLLKHFFNGVFPRTMGPTLTALLGGRGMTDSQADRVKLREEVWALLASTLLCAVGMAVQLRPSNPCRFSDTRPCIWGWPHEPSAAESTYMAAEAVYYVYNVLRSTFGLSTVADRPEMRAHHLVTLCLLITCRLLQLQRLGVMTLALLSMTTPLLHLSKLLNVLERPWGRVAVFVVFSVVWIVTRVVLFASTVIACVLFQVRPAVRDARLAHGQGAVSGTREALAEFAVRNLTLLHMFFSVSFFALYCLQIFWTIGILRVFGKILTTGSGAGGHLARKLDTARHVPAAAPEFKSDNGAASLEADGAQGGPSQARVQVATGRAFPSEAFEDGEGEGKGRPRMRPGHPSASGPDVQTVQVE